jgi:hypothetical protein
VRLAKGSSEYYEDYVACTRACAPTSPTHAMSRHVTRPFAASIFTLMDTHPDEDMEELGVADEATRAALVDLITDLKRSATSKRVKPQSEPSRRASVDSYSQEIHSLGAALGLPPSPPRHSLVTQTSAALTLSPSPPRVSLVTQPPPPTALPNVRRISNTSQA